MHIYYIIVCLCQLLQTFSVDAMFSRAGSMRKQPLSQARVISPTIRPSLWSRMKTSVNSYFTQKSSLHTSAPVYQEKGSQQQAASQSDDVKNRLYKVHKTPGFFQSMLNNYRLKQYDTNEKRFERIWQILSLYPNHIMVLKDTFTAEEIDEIYNLFLAMQIEPHNYKLRIFSTLAEIGLGQNDERFKELYKKIELFNTKKYFVTQYNVEDFINPNTASQIINLVQSILGSFYKDYPEAIDYAYKIYEELPEQYQKDYFKKIIALGGTSNNKNQIFRNIYKRLFYNALDAKPDIYIISAIKMYDTENKEAMDYANHMIERLKVQLRKENESAPNADNIAIIGGIMREIDIKARENQRINSHLGIHSTPSFSHEEQMIVKLLLKEAFDEFKKNNIDPRKFPWWNGFHEKLLKFEIGADDGLSGERLPFSSKDPRVNLFKKYGFEPLPNNGQQSDQKRQSGPKQKPTPQYDAQWAYKTLELPYDTPFKEAKLQRNRLAKKYHPDKAGDLATMQNLNKALDIIEGYKKLKKRPEDL